MTNLMKRDRDNSDQSCSRQLDNSFDNFFDNRSVDFFNSLGKTFQPRVNISEDEKFYYVDAEMSGVKKPDIKVQYHENGTLSISAQKQEGCSSDKRNYHLVECFNGSFYRSFQLPENVDRNNIKAEMTDGVLKITLQKTAKRDSRTTEIRIN